MELSIAIYHPRLIMFTRQGRMMAKKEVTIIGRAKQTRSKGLDEAPKATHSQLCKAIVQYMKAKHPDKLFIHIPNEGNVEMMGKLKAEGLLPGAYDYILCHVKVTRLEDGSFNFTPGLFVEVKTLKDRLSKAQKEFRDRALKAHYATVEVYSIDQFIAAIEEYCSESSAIPSS